MEDPERKAERNRRYYENHREEIKDRTRRWTAANPDTNAANTRTWRLRNPTAKSESDRRWRAANPEAVREIWNRARIQRRRLLANAVSDTHTRREIFDRDGWTCRMDDCLSPSGRMINDSLDPSQKWAATEDHIVPLSLGGDHTRENVRTAHRHCNMVRGNRI